MCIKITIRNIERISPSTSLWSFSTTQNIEELKGSKKKKMEKKNQ